MMLGSHVISGSNMQPFSSYLASISLQPGCTNGIRMFGQSIKIVVHFEKKDINPDKKCLLCSRPLSVKSGSLKLGKRLLDKFFNAKCHNVPDITFSPATSGNFSSIISK